MPQFVVGLVNGSTIELPAYVKDFELDGDYVYFYHDIGCESEYVGYIRSDAVLYILPKEEPNDKSV